MPFALVGLSQKTAPVEIREQAYVPESGVGECLRRLVDRDLIDGGVLLSTCNRTELYAVARGEGADDRLLEAFGEWPHQLDYETWRRHAYRLAGDAALEHLFQVACGLDSMVLGEAQVLGQLKRALEHAREAGALKPSLYLIVRGAIRAGKRVRHETDLGRNAVSVSHAAVAQAQQVLGVLTGRSVLLLGAGTMSEVALRLLRNHGVTRSYVVSRTVDRADRIARPLGARAIDFEAIEEIAEDIDIIISSSSAPYYLLDSPRVMSLQARRGARPLLIIDIAMPRDVDPDTSQVPGVRLYNVDDLRVIAETNLKDRQAAVPAAERILEEELARTQQSLQARESAPLIAALVRFGERIRDAELERALARIPQADLVTRRALRGLADALTAKFLHAPIRHIKDSTDPKLDGEILREAFDLEPETTPSE